MSNVRFLGIPRLGSKSSILKQLLETLEGVATERKYKFFVDLCSGGMKIIGNINQNLFNVLIANDIEPGIVALASTFKNPIATKLVISLIDELIEIYKKKPKDLFIEASNYLTLRTDARLSQTYIETDYILMAAYTIIVAYSQHKNNEKEFWIHNFSKNFLKRRVHTELLDYNTSFENIVVKNEDLFKFLETYGGCEDMLIYADVPYHPDAMASTEHYRCNLTKEQHQRLCKILTSDEFKATFILSGWKNDDYRDLLEKSGKVWDYCLGDMTLTSGKGAKKEERIWTNTYIPDEYLPKRKQKAANSVINNGNGNDNGNDIDAISDEASTEVEDSEDYDYDYEEE
jgi:DNA adenine methylase